ncbi:MAG: hypothetical protein JRG74_04705 [Deltaproteobacteria bacterium]|nr:hypothetical protein [Deltaproteobacteria bacterium]MBW2165406.1 hypothetical protein [Deltaproteobacteria bacterium]
MNTIKIKGLTEEYRALLRQSTNEMSEPSKNIIDEIKKLLVDNGEWSHKASEHLLDLAINYGSFMLRNALALSLALQIEDGELGF